jgi:hypothetical protein
VALCLSWQPPALSLGAAAKAGHVEQLDDQRAWSSCVEHCESEAVSDVEQLEARGGICESREQLDG